MQFLQFYHPVHWFFLQFCFNPLLTLYILKLLPFIFKRFYLFIFREGKGGRKRGRETPVCGCLSRAPYWGPGLKPRHVPWLGIEPATLWFTGRRSIHWATPARAKVITFNDYIYFSFLEVPWLLFKPIWLCLKLLFPVTLIIAFKKFFNVSNSYCELVVLGTMKLLWGLESKCTPSDNWDLFLPGIWAPNNLGL